MSKEAKIEETLEYIVSNMATKEDIAEIMKEMRSLNDRVSAFEKRLSSLESKIDNLSGITKEMDFIRSEFLDLRSYVRKLEAKIDA